MRPTDAVKLAAKLGLLATASMLEVIHAHQASQLFLIAARKV